MEIDDFNPAEWNRYEWYPKTGTLAWFREDGTIEMLVSQDQMLDLMRKWVASREASPIERESVECP